MNKAFLSARIFLGLVFFVFGLNGFFNFIPASPLPAEGGAFMGSLAQTGYFFPLLKTVETLCGFLLLADLFVPLVLILLAPIVVQIAFFHLFLAPVTFSLILAALLVIAMFTLAHKYRDIYLPLLKPKP